MQDTTTTMVKEATMLSTSSTEDQRPSQRRRSSEILRGRDEEQAKLKDLLLFFRSKNDDSRPQLVIISGQEGIGKSSLVANACYTALDDAMIVVLLWRFDGTFQAGFDNAWSDLMQLLLSRSPPQLLSNKLRIAIESSTSEEDRALLMHMIPTLKHILEKQQQHHFMMQQLSSSEANSRRQRLTVLKSLVHVLSDEFPLIVVFEDLELADACSQTIVEALLTDRRSSSSIKFVATIGDALSARPSAATTEQSPEASSSLSNNHQQADAEWVSKIHGGFNNRITIVHSMELSELDAKSVNLVVADVMNMDPIRTESFSEQLYKAVGGTPLVVLWNLERLRQRSSYWGDDEEEEEQQAPRSESAPEFLTLKQLVLEKLGTLPQQVQEFLRTAATLGRNMELPLLNVLLTDEACSCIHTAVKSGLVVPVDDSEAGKFRFAHDVVRRTLLRIAPPEEEAPLCLFLGRQLLQGLNSTQLEQYMELVLDLFHRGEQCLTSSRERHRVAHLCLRAAKQSLEWSSFQRSYEYLEFGISLLSERSWREEYDLSLALFNHTTEVSYTIGAFPRAEELIQEVLVNARVVEDKMQANCSKLYILAARAQMSDALDFGFNVLRQLGVVMHPNPSAKRQRLEYIRMQRFMKKHKPPHTTMLNLKPMTDSRMATALQIMSLLFTAASFGRPSTAPLLIMKMVRITVDHGLCAISALGFGLYGLVLTGFGGELEQGAMFGDIALILLQRFNTKQWLPRVYLPVYGVLFGWTRPVGGCMEQLHRAYIMGLETGDIEASMMCANIRVTWFWTTTLTLPMLRQEIVAVREEMISLRQEHSLKLLDQFLYVIASLESTRGVVVFDELAGTLETDPNLSKNYVYNFWTCFKRMIVAYIWCDYEEAAKEAKVAKQYEAILFFACDVCYCRLLESLVLLSQWETSSLIKRRKILKRVRYFMSLMEHWKEYNLELHLGKTELLRAEIEAVTGKHAQARKHYLSAIALFDREDQLQLHAIACERAGRYLFGRGSSAASRSLLQEAVGVYTRWGATGKAALLQEEMIGLFGNKENSDATNELVESDSSLLSPRQ